jgi:hypothetical protein
MGGLINGDGKADKCGDCKRDCEGKVTKDL